MLREVVTAPLFVKRFKRISYCTSLIYPWNFQEKEAVEGVHVATLANTNGLKRNFAATSYSRVKRGLIS